MSKRAQAGFTLVELLVVVAILSLLLALLTPSLQRAKYITRLAICASNLHAVAGGVSLYAAENRNAYPSRSGVPAGQKCNFLGSQGVGDDRPKLMPYMSLNDALVCPLTGSIDLTQELAPSSSIHATYDLWFGWKFISAAAAGGLTHTESRLGYASFKFDILACDRDIFNPGGAWVHGTHPDSDRVGWNEVRQLQPVSNVASSYRFTLSRWINYTTNRRGTIDRNFAHTDNSVDRMSEVALGDSRMVIVPEFSNGDLSWAVCQLPPLK